MLLRQRGSQICSKRHDHIGGPPIHRVGTGIAGFRAKLGLIDDPIRSRQDADSELVRDRIWDWYINDFKTRLVPHAAEILIQTRWHEDDPAGRALNHEEWRVISLPALAEADDPLGRGIGEPLWCDDSYGYGEQLIELSTKTPARTWSALYQQRPAPEQGGYFQVDWLQPYDRLPPRETLRRDPPWLSGSHTRRVLRRRRCLAPPDVW
jgi:hypothetical protein